MLRYQWSYVTFLLIWHHLSSWQVECDRLPMTATHSDTLQNVDIARWCKYHLNKAQAAYFNGQRLHGTKSIVSQPLSNKTSSLCMTILTNPDKTCQMPVNATENRKRNRVNKQSPFSRHNLLWKKSANSDGLSYIHWMWSSDFVKFLNTSSRALHTFDRKLNQWHLFGLRQLPNVNIRNTCSLSLLELRTELSLESHGRPT